MKTSIILRNGKELTLKRFLLVVGTFMFQILAYYGARAILKADDYSVLSSAWDEAIPFVPVFIIFYIGAFVQWILYYQRLTVEDERTCRWFMTAEIMTKLISMFIFIRVPLTIIRPVVAPKGIFKRLTRMIYFVDTPTELLPSLHCVQSWLSFRLLMNIRKEKKWLIVLAAVFTLGVFASTLFVKQHYLADVAVGILLAEICLQITSWFFRQKDRELIS